MAGLSRVEDARERAYVPATPIVMALPGDDGSYVIQIDPKPL